MDRFHVAYIATIFFQSAMLFNASSNAYAQTDPIIRIKLSSTTYSDETIIRFKDETTTSFDFEYDAYKIMSGRTTPSMYSSIGTTDYSINSIPAADSLPNILLGTKIMEDGLYSMTFESSTGLYNYVLLDNKTGTEIAVDSSSTYSFTGLIADASNRFELHYKTESSERSNISLANNNFQASEVYITSSLGGIYVSMTNATVDRYTIEFIRVGGTVAESVTKEIYDHASYNEFIETKELTAGNYLVKLTKGEIASSFHVIIL